MKKLQLELYWSEIPVGKENAVTYDDLIDMWDVCERQCRDILHRLSHYDNGDNYILVRSAKGKGFYRTDDEKTIKAYMRECLNRGRNTFAPLKKIRRVLNVDESQLSFYNNLRAYRIASELSQDEVCKQMREVDKYFDAPLLSKMENGICLPTHIQLSALAGIYCCFPEDLISTEILINRTFPENLFANC